MKKAIMNWSGGKDSAMALYRMLREKKYGIESLLTTVTKPFQRVSMHGIRESLLDQQAAAVDIPLQKVFLTEHSSLEEYELEMTKALDQCIDLGITHSIFGDIFLEDLRKYRDTQLSRAGIKGLYPLWKEDTTQLAEAFIDAAFKCIVVCVDERYLDKSFIGRTFNTRLLTDIPDNVDPCGENGEFHTFVYDGPVFKQPIPFSKGDVTYRKYDGSSFNSGFWYLDLVQKG